jgi:hypothetical protein
LLPDWILFSLNPLWLSCILLKLRCPGQLAIGYADLYGNVKHYLIEPNELKKKTVAEFLNETSIFTEVLQVLALCAIKTLDLCLSVVFFLITTGVTVLFSIYCDCSVLRVSAWAFSTRRRNQSFARFRRKSCWLRTWPMPLNRCTKRSLATILWSIHGPPFHPVCYV